VGYKTAWLLWPDSENWPDDGEIDFPEGDLDVGINAYAHWANPKGGQDAFEPKIPYDSWHVATTEWAPGRITFILDGKVLGVSTKQVPSKAMHYVLQSESRLIKTPPPPNAAGHITVDWFVAYSYNPATALPVAPVPSANLKVWTYSSAAYLSAFNGERQKYGLKRFVWDARLAASSLAYAKKCKYAPSTTIVRSHDYAVRRGVAYAKTYAQSVGENIAARMTGIPANVWNGDRTLWTCGARACKPGKACQKYVQIVWEKTARVGCAGVTCPSGSPYGARNGGKWNFMVCRYNPSALPLKAALPFAAGRCKRP